LKIAGILATTSSYLTLPLVFVYLSYRLIGRVDSKAIFIQTAVQLSGTFLFVTISLYFKKLLNSLFKFQDTDRNIDLMIVASVIAGILSIIALYFSTLKESIGFTVIILMVAQGIVQFQFGYKLLKLPNDLGGILKPFCYANMATGIFLATVLLIPMGILVSAISDLMLGTIFFKMSKAATASELSKA
jgi:hypothetical protein